MYRGQGGDYLKVALIEKSCTTRTKSNYNFILIVQFHLLHEYFFMQELKNVKILNGKLNERASRYSHFELNGIAFDENKLPGLV